MCKYKNQSVRFIFDLNEHWIYCKTMMSFPMPIYGLFGKLLNHLICWVMWKLLLMVENCYMLVKHYGC
jgi:hypothetical protein